MHYRGLTWGHPRGFQALRVLAERFSADGQHDDTLSWDVHPLEEFESASIEELADRYDLIVLDHPHIGDALVSGSLQPVSGSGRDGFASLESGEFVGPSVRSYALAGSVWALPLDAAAQVAAYDPSRLCSVPSTWDDVDALSEQEPVALSLAGPHALLTLYSFCVALGEAPGGLGELSRDAAEHALARMTGIAGRMDPDWIGLNPIGLLERISSRSDIAYCPLVFGYVNYSVRPMSGGGESWRVAFADAPRVGGRAPGSVIGGTGLAVSSRAEVSDALAAHLAMLIDDETQSGIIVREAGQPSRSATWASDVVDRASGGFYSATRETLEASWVRPRFAGYTAFQGSGSAIVRDIVLGRISPGRGLEDYEALRRRAISGMKYDDNGRPLT